MTIWSHIRHISSTLTWSACFKLVQRISIFCNCPNLWFWQQFDRQSIFSQINNFLRSGKRFGLDVYDFLKLFLNLSNFVDYFQMKITSNEKNFFTIRLLLVYQACQIFLEKCPTETKTVLKEFKFLNLNHYTKLKLNLVLPI
ncbi:hypothetical protein BpHYR1_014314 [Brachionus plicatilis]|uniref:Uncharacterized protein n=1 Tax=Brachionus plicatilis TaxID=10195 RepID=A0A3M7R6N5_BRAPC|nr:hypothetical protein BpHYR1_014314 [Brachionus plicatilis]